MATVYLLSEDDLDEQIYAYILEAVLSCQVEAVPHRLRPSGGVNAVRAVLPLFIRAIRRAGQQDGMYFVVGIDNDRALEHSSHERENPALCRHCMVTAAIHAEMRDGWPIPGAVAVPVQMIEAWLLLMHAPEKYVSEANLPAFSRRDSPSARMAHGPEPPPQVKDLRDAERGELSKEDFAVACVLKLDQEDLAARSPSFALFRDAVSKWKA